MGNRIRERVRETEKERERATKRERKKINEPDLIPLLYVELSQCFTSFVVFRNINYMKRQANVCFIIYTI